jgi:hypothetical protein
MTLMLNIDPVLEQRLREHAARRGINPDSYAVAAIEERLRLDSGPPARLSHEESELLSQISVGLSEEIWRHYDQLIAKRRAESLTPDEHQKLMQITNTIEEDHARRIGLLVKLAHLRNVPLESLMRDLGIGPRRLRDDGHD